MEPQAGGVTDSHALEGPPIEPTPVAMPVSEPVAAPAPAPEPADDAYVPVAAVHAVRQENRALKDQLAQTAQQAQQVGALQQQIADLSARLAQLTPPAPVAAEGPIIGDDLARAWALKHQLYKADGSGQPDLEAARDALMLVDQLATEKARRTLEPIAQQTARDRAQRHREQLSTLKDPSGRPIDPAAIQQIFSIIPPEVAADPNAAVFLAMAAAGAERFITPAPVAPPAQAPVYTERAGGQTTGPSVSDFEVRFLKSQGRGTKEHVEALKKFKPGEPSPLE